MAEIKLLKINSSGFNAEHDSSADDIVFNDITAGNQIDVTSGVTLTNNITFNAVTDTIAGIQNQNLLDKTANESITGDWTIETGHALTITDAPVNGTDAVNKDYADALISGIEWQDSVLDKDLNAAPGAPTTGDRYIVGTGVASGDDWFGEENNIAEWDGSQWVFTTVQEGFGTWIDDEDAHYVYNGSAWVKFGSTVTHNNLSGLQGGNGSTEYYHMTATEDTWLAAALVAVPDGSNLADITGTETISGTWNITGELDINAGDLVLPSAAMGSPEEGSIYWDASSDILYVYDGSNYVNVNTGGEAEKITVLYTAGENLAQYDAVYVSGNDTVMKAAAGSLPGGKCIGIATTAINSAATGYICTEGLLAGAITSLGFSAGDTIWLDTTAGALTNTVPTGAGNIVIKVGYAKNTTDMYVRIGEITVRAS